MFLLNLLLIIAEKDGTMQFEPEISSACRVRVFLYGPLAVFQRASDGHWVPVEKNKWGPGKATRSVFKRLLAAPGRRVSRIRLQEDIWPATDFELADKHLYNAMSVIHQAIGKDLVKTWEAMYELANQSLIWVDHDACLALIKTVEDQMIEKQEVVPLLETALHFLEHGAYLEREEGIWCHSLTLQAEMMLRQCRIWLAEGYEEQDKLWQAGEQYRALLQTTPADESALYAWMTMLHRHGQTQEALTCFREYTTFLEQREGHRYSSQLEEYAASLRNQQVFVAQHLPLLRYTVTAPFSFVPSASSELDTLDIIRPRRQALQDIVGMASAALLLSPSGLFDGINQERLEQTMLRPARLDEGVLQDLSLITERYWSICKNASVDVINGVAGHFASLTRLLKETHPPVTYRKLCSLSSESALLLGKTFHDMREYELAWAYYLFALKAAKEAGNDDLRAAGRGRMALSLIYWERPEQALALLQQEQQVHLQNTTVRAWLAVIEAEVHALLGKSSPCLNMLDCSQQIAQSIGRDDDPYGTGFNASRLAGYEGACFLHLHTPERALPALQQALQLCDSTAKRRRSMLLTDIGAVFGQLGEVAEASTLLLQALDITEETKSLIVLQRVQKARKSLQPWATRDVVQQIDERLRFFVQALAHTRAS